MIGIGNTQLREVCAAMLVLIYLKSQHLDMTGHEEMIRDETGQDRTRQDGTGRDETRRD